MMYNKQHNHKMLFFRFHQKAAFFFQNESSKCRFKILPNIWELFDLKDFFKPLFITQLYIEKVIFLKRKKKKKTHLECCWNKKGYRFYVSYFPNTS